MTTHNAPRIDQIVSGIGDLCNSGEPCSTLVAAKEYISEALALRLVLHLHLQSILRVDTTVYELPSYIHIPNREYQTTAQAQGCTDSSDGCTCAMRARFQAPKLNVKCLYDLSALIQHPSLKRADTAGWAACLPGLQRFC